MNDHTRLIDTKAAAAWLGISPNTLKAWRVRGCGPCYVKVGRKPMYQLTDLDDFVEANRCYGKEGVS